MNLTSCPYIQTVYQKRTENTTLQSIPDDSYSSPAASPIAEVFIFDLLHFTHFPENPEATQLLLATKAVRA